MINAISLIGHMIGAPVENHEIYGEKFYDAVISVERLSGVNDQLPITIPGRAMPEDKLLKDGQRVMITGQIRAYNKLVEGANRLIVTVFARQISDVLEGAQSNLAKISGTLVKPPVYRQTPLGREICDLLVCVPRSFGKTDIVPCIAWGKNAKYCERLLVGQNVSIEGRLQSREYQKQVAQEESITKTAYELSVTMLDLAAPEQQG